MKNIITLLLMGFIAANATAQQKVMVNDANAQQRAVSGFTEISVSGGIDLYLSPDNKETVVVSASEERYRDRIVTRVVNNRLEIYFDNKRLSWKWPSNMKLKAYVSFKTLNKLKASGASDVYVNGIIKAESLQIEVSGASDFNGAVDVNELAIDQSGSSDARLSGRAEKLTVEVSGASDMKGYDLQVNYCEAHASGSSDIQVTVNKELSAKASGSSDIYYRGGGLIREIKTSGSSSVSKKG